MRLILLTAAILIAAPAYAQDGSDTFYALTKDSGSAKLLLLDSVDGGPANTSVLILDVFSRPKTGMLQTLEFNCPKGTYAVVRKSMFQPGSSPVESKARGASQRVPMGTQLSFVANLVCSGNGNLEKSKVMHSTIKDVLSSYWDK